MNLAMQDEIGSVFKSASQKAGSVTEAWGADNFYCPNCSSPKLDWLKPGTKANDYRCPACGFWFQLKSQKSKIGSTITDGAYAAMMEAIKEDRSPNFYFLHYDYATWTVRNLLLVPHFAFPPSAIIKRKPLSATARRAGWVGCNFDLRRIPTDARIEVVVTRNVGRRRGDESQTEESSQSLLTSSPTSQTLITPSEVVREKFKRVKPLREISVKERGWTLDVLNIVQRLGKAEFAVADVYAFASELEKLHPDNRHINDKIRQQLQVLRDRGFLLNPERGVWRLPGFRIDRMVQDFCGRLKSG